MKFFVWSNDQQQGPFDEETIQLMISAGQITRNTLLCPEGGDLDWTPAKELFFQQTLPESLTLPPTAVELSQQPDDGCRLRVRLASGTELEIKAVQLYDEIAVAKVNSKKAEAIKLLKGVSTGIGAWGSIEWVLEATAVIGAVESVLSAGTSLAGADTLKEAIQADCKLHSEGTLFPVGKIQYIENSKPSFWRAILSQNAQVRVQSFKSLTLQNRPEIEIRTENKVRGFVHNGDDFINVQTDDGALSSIRWGAIEQYFYSKFPS